MENSLYIVQSEDRKKSIVLAVTVHLLLLLLCFFPYMTVKSPAEPISGILVALGTPDGGNSNDIAASTADSPSTEEDSPAEASNTTEEVEKSPSPSKVETAPKEVEPTPEPVTEKQLTDDTTPPIIKEPTEQEKKAEKEAQERAEAERKQKEAERLAAEEARKAAEEKAAKEAAYNKSKKQYSDLFGSGRGTNNNTGNQGDPNGDPNADNLKGIAKGSGRIGGGLSDRGVLYEPAITDNTQKVGKVVIKVCVDPSGKVTEAKFTQRGSTTTDAYLIDKAQKAALKYKFTTSSIETQCGTITVDFQVGT